MADIPHKNNFDLLRLTLAFSVCLAHLAEVSGVSEFRPLALYFNSGVAVDCFFIVSGFLIFRSYNRSPNLLYYCGKRIRRIYPAYLTVILLAVLLLPLLSSATDIFFSPPWFRYLFSNLAFLNFVQPDLPGVFTTNPLQAINPPLWTIKVEVMFYCSVPLIFLLLKNHKKWLVLTILYLGSTFYSMVLLNIHQSSGSPIYQTLAKQFPGQLVFFLGGGGIYLYISFFQRHRFTILLPSLFFLLSKNYPVPPALYPLALSVSVIFFALYFPYLGNFGKFGDISYGVYIYHFPLIQLFTAFNFFQESPWLAFALLILSILTMASLSYHFVERPFLGKRSHYRRATEGKAT